MEDPLAAVRYLADDALQGREAGHPGARCAGDYLAARFQEIGLAPVTADHSFFQTFPIRVGARLGEGNHLEISTETHERGKTWTPYGFASSDRVEGELAWAGSGVPSRDRHSDGTLPEIRGRIAVVEGGASEGAGLYSDPHFKATVAAGRGAAGLLILLPEGHPLPDLAHEARPAVGIPVAAVTGAAADDVRRQARAGAPATLEVEVEPRAAEARNVVGLLPGVDPALRDELVVVGAHYDHLGFGGEGSMAEGVRAVHNGADDNASGTAALLEIAEELAGGQRPARSVLFIAFSGEEKGLLGSVHYVENPLVPLDRTVAMLNLDMVGRLRDGTVTVFGTATAEEWSELVARANESLPEPLTLALRPDGYGPSDHASFYGKGIPVLHFFTNTHPQYHRPEDDWETVNARGIERVAGLATETVRRLTAGPGAPGSALTPVEAVPDPHGGRAPSSRDREPDESPDRGYGPYLGTIPDMAAMSGENGVRLTGVREGSPADEAGLRAGDVIVEFGGEAVGDLYDYTYALRAHAPGDEVEIVVARDGERLTLTAVLGERR